MKLRNKKTGEIVERIWWDEEVDELCLSGNHLYFYNSLTELNEEWEDYEESKEWWFIDCTGHIKHGEGLFTEKTYIKGIQEIGNYFETEEEAEKAVEKLKAWKRLKDVGFKFTDWHRDICEVAVSAEIYDDGTMGMVNDLDLLFGGEE